MRRDVRELRAFYAGPLGRMARDAVARKLAEAWERARGLDVLGLGYATPYLGAFDLARRTVAAMPAGQGVELWPAFRDGGERNLTALTAETALPFPNALFDRVLVVHGLEESDSPAALLAEARRVLAPSGRLVAAVASRRGLWSRADATPFGHGRPFTRTQLEALVREAGLEPTAWSRALYAPPHELFAGWAEGLEQAGSRLAAPMAGLILLEAVKQTFAVRPRGAKAPALAPRGLRPAPVPASRAPAPAVPTPHARSCGGAARRPSVEPDRPTDCVP